MAYHVDCLYAAVSVLAGHGHIKQRLISAYEDHIDKIRHDEMPAASREAFLDLQEKMHRVAPLNGEGTICASVRKMSVQEASACAVSILGLYRDVARHERDFQHSHPIDTAEAVPPLLVRSN